MVTEKEKKRRHEYRRAAIARAPKRPIVRNTALAFLVGGTITTIGQVFLNLMLSLGLEKKDAIGMTAVIMIGIGALLTGLGWYNVIGKIGGMGSALPITGFANSIVASAMEFKREGFVFGVGARMFQIAGPVIVYGVVTAMIIGILALTLQGFRPGG